MKINSGLFFLFSIPVKTSIMMTSISLPFYVEIVVLLDLNDSFFLNDDQEDEIAKRIWANLLVVQVIRTGLPQYKKEHFKATLYSPHYPARQLGFSQAITRPLPRNGDSFCHITLTSQEDFNTCLLKNQRRREHFNFLVYN